jgi:aldehyde dehydrogenase (NAD+)
MATDKREALAEALAVFFPSEPRFGSYIDGHLVVGRGESITIDDPSTGVPLFDYPDAAADVAQEGVAAASKGFGAWASVNHAGRGRVMQAIGRKILGNAEALARLEMLGSGKPIRDCRVEVAKVAEMFEYYAGWTDKLYGDVIPVPSTHLNYTQREPFGVLLQITPWNAPLFTCGWQLAPALATGNAVVLKPSERTPFTSLALAALAESAGLPVGVFNVLSGYGHTTVQAALAEMAVKKVVFVGSPDVGAQIASAAAALLKPSVLELGGKSANIVFADSDLERAAIGAQAACFAGAGQSCVAGSRLLIQTSVYERMLELLTKGARRIRVGDPGDQSTDIGPINNARQFAHVRAMIDKGLAQGARLLSETVTIGNGGFFVPPTVLADVTNDMDIAQREVFGPVVAAIRFDTEEEAIAIANDSRFGLAGAVWTHDVARAHRVASAVRAGTFWINSYKTINVATPFGGYNHSGYGRSSGVEVLREYTQVKSIWVETARTPATPFGYSADVEA